MAGLRPLGFCSAEKFGVDGVAGADVLRGGERGVKHDWTSTVKASRSKEKGWGNVGLRPEDELSRANMGHGNVLNVWCIIRREYTDVGVATV